MIDLTTLIILGLATARLTILFSRDDIFENIRDRVYHVSPPADNPREGWYYLYKKRATRGEYAQSRSVGLNRVQSLYVGVDQSEPPRNTGFVGSLIACPHCLGVWVGAAVTVAWWLDNEHTTMIALPFALAMIVSLIRTRVTY